MKKKSAEYLKYLYMEKQLTKQDLSLVIYGFVNFELVTELIIKAQKKLKEKWKEESYDLEC